MERLKHVQGMLLSGFDKLLYGFIYLWTGIYTKHAQHPRILKLCFYTSLAYALVLLVTLTHTYDNVKLALYNVFPGLVNASSEYTGHADNCSDWSYQNVMNCIDVFVLAHFVGYAIRGVVFRDLGFCWMMSITWEVTELAFRHLNPISFLECWWDAIIIDILIFNAIGIWFGIYMCKRLQLKMFHWDSKIIRHEHDGSGKERRDILTWQPSKCLANQSAYKRVLLVSIFLIVSQISELNLFFLKKLLRIPPGHFLCLLRTWIISTTASPAVLEVYSYMTSGKRIGASAYLWLGIVAVEASVCFKFGVEVLESSLNMTYMFYWITFQVFLSCMYLLVSTKLSQRKLAARGEDKEDVEERNGIAEPNKPVNYRNGSLTNGYSIDIGEKPEGMRKRIQQVGFYDSNGLPR